jgi:Transglycosylase
MNNPVSRSPRPKSGRWKKVAIIAILLLAILCAGSYLAMQKANDLARKELDRRLSEIATQFGIRVSYGQLDLDLLRGAQLNSVRVTNPADPANPLATIEAIRIKHAFVTAPAFGVTIKRVVLVEPGFFAEIRPDGSVNVPLAAALSARKTPIPGSSPSSDSIAKPTSSSGLSARVKIPDEIRVRVKGGTLLARDGCYVGRATPFDLRISGLNGMARLDRKRLSVTADVAGSIEGNGGKIAVHIQAEKEKADLTLNGESVQLALFSPYLPGIILPEPSTEFSGSVELHVKKGQTVHSVRFDGAVKNLAVEHRRIASKPVRGINFDARGLVDWNSEEKRLILHHVTFGLDGAYMSGTGSVGYGDHLTLAAYLFCKQLPIQSALDALPEDFIPYLKGTQTTGTLDFHLNFELDMARPGDLVLEPKIEVHDFEVIREPPSVQVKRMQGPFTHNVRRDGQVVQTIFLDESNEDFVPFENLGHTAKRGVLTCEDGRFFSHNGFQFKHIKQSLITDLKKGRFVRGASTITMQTAKNLFLSGEKTISRKFQEMLIAYYMEQTLSKERMFEIYMNIIEWGPDLYGIGPAASHYFYRSPNTLKPIEAAFLGSIIANPKRYHFMYDRGQVTEAWSTYLQLIVSKMGLGEEAYLEAEPYLPEFGWVRKKREAEEKKAKEEAGEVETEEESGPTEPSKKMSDEQIET